MVPSLRMVSEHRVNVFQPKLRAGGSKQSLHSLGIKLQYLEELERVAAWRQVGPALRLYPSGCLWIFGLYDLKQERMNRFAERSKVLRFSFVLEYSRFDDSIR